MKTHTCSNINKNCIVFRPLFQSLLCISNYRTRARFPFIALGKSQSAKIPSHSFLFRAWTSAKALDFQVINRLSHRLWSDFTRLWKYIRPGGIFNWNCTVEIRWVVELPHMKSRVWTIRIFQCSCWNDGKLYRVSSLILSKRTECNISHGPNAIFSHIHHTHKFLLIYFSEIKIHTVRCLIMYQFW